MLLPTKHIKISQSLIGLSGLLYSLFDGDDILSLENLYECYEKKAGTKKFPARHTLDHLLLALDFLYLMNLIELTEGGELKKAKIERH